MKCSSNLRKPAAFIAALLFALSLTAVQTSATTSTGSLSVSASIPQNCIVSSPTLAFGSYDPVVTNRSANLDSTIGITMTCTKGATGITLGFGNSTHAPAGCTAPARCMIGAVHSNYLAYQIYSDSSGGTVWTTAISETVSGGITTPSTVTIYGRIPGAQDMSIDTYSDTVTATINF